MNNTRPAAAPRTPDEWLDVFKDETYEWLDPDGTRQAFKRYEANEDDLGRLVHDVFGHEMRYVKELRTWRICSRTSRPGFWSDDDRGGARQRVRGALRAYAEARALQQFSVATDKWAKGGRKGDEPTPKDPEKALMSDRHVDSVLRSAGDRLSAREDDFDADRGLLGLRDDAVLDLRLMRKREVRPGDMMTQRCEATVEFDAVGQVVVDDDSRWLRHIKRVTGEDDGKAEFLQRAAGITLLGDVVEHGFVLLHGDGRNGKGVLIRVMSKVLGGYAKPVPRSMLVGEDDSHPADTMPMYKTRMAYAEEMGKEKLKPARLKTFTGGDRMMGRDLYKGFGDGWMPYHTLWINLNELVRTGNDTSVGLWDRVWLVETGPTIPPEERDPQWEMKLLERPDDVLGWMVQGLQRYRGDAACKAGLQLTDEMKRDRDAWKMSEDGVARFAATIEPGRHQSQHLYNSYRVWWSLEGLLGKPEAKQEFGRRFVKVTKGRTVVSKVDGKAVRFLEVPQP